MTSSWMSAAAWKNSIALASRTSGVGVGTPGGAVAPVEERRAQPLAAAQQVGDHGRAGRRRRDPARRARTAWAASSVSRHCCTRRAQVDGVERAGHEEPPDTPRSGGRMTGCPEPTAWPLGYPHRHGAPWRRGTARAPRGVHPRTSGRDAAVDQLRVLPAQGRRVRGGAVARDPPARAGAPRVRVGHLRRRGHHPGPHRAGHEADRPRDLADPAGPPHLRRRLGAPGCARWSGQYAASGVRNILALRGDPPGNVRGRVDAAPRGPRPRRPSSCR